MQMQKCQCLFDQQIHEWGITRVQDTRGMWFRSEMTKRALHRLGAVKGQADNLAGSCILQCRTDSTDLCLCAFATDGDALFLLSGSS